MSSRFAPSAVEHMMVFRHGVWSLAGTIKAGKGGKANGEQSLTARVAAATQQRQKLEAILQQDRENLILEQSRHAGSPHAELHNSQLQDMVEPHPLLPPPPPPPPSPFPSPFLFPSSIPLVHDIGPVLQGQVAAKIEGGGI